MQEPSREQIDALPGTTLLEFGATWCGFCQAARPLIDRALGENPHIRHIQIEDGKGRRLGRSFGVKLWPTLIVMHDGSEVARLVRPRGLDQLRDALSLATHAPAETSRV